MKSNYILFFIVLFVLLVSGAIIWNYRGLAPAPEKTPNSAILALEPRVFDLGTVIYGQVATYTIQLTNLSSAPVEILKLSTSCGCTKAQMAEEDKIIAPGAAVPLLVSFDPAVHQDDTDVGLLKRVVYINTNHPEAPELSAEFSASVIKK